VSIIISSWIALAVIPYLLCVWHDYRRGVDLEVGDLCVLMIAIILGPMFWLVVGIILLFEIATCHLLIESPYKTKKKGGGE